MRLLPRSFFRQLSVIELTLLFSMLFVQLLLFLRLWNLFDRHVRQAIQWDLADEVAAEIEHSSGTPGSADISAILTSFARANPGTDIFVLDDAFRVVSSSTPEPGAIGARIDPEPIRRFLRQSSGLSWMIDGRHPITGREQLISAAELGPPGAQGAVYATLPEPAARSIWRLMRMHPFGVPAWLPWLACFLALGLAAVRFIGASTRTFGALAPVVERFAVRRFELGIGGSAPAEIAEHMSALRTMASAIEENMRELEAKNRLQSELVANISHDLRGPVTLIRAYSEELSRPGGPLPEKERPFIDTIRSNAETLKERIAELGELADFEERRMPMKMESLRLEEIASTLAAAYAEEAERRGLQLRFRADGALPDVAADPVLLRRVLSNLIENSLRYAPPGGTIEIVAAHDGGHVRCSVSNAGRGVAAAELPRLFERSFQDPAQAAKEKGAAGLGLSIVRAIVEAHGGRCSIVPLAEGGLEVTFDLPCAP